MRNGYLYKLALLSQREGVPLPLSGMSDGPYVDLLTADPILLAAGFEVSNPAAQAFGLGLPAPAVIVFDPSAVRGEEVYTTWAQIALCASSFRGPVTVYVPKDATVLAGSYVMPANWNLVLAPNRTLTLADGVLWSTAPRLIAGQASSLNTENSIAPNVTYTTVGDPGFLLIDDVFVTNAGSGSGDFIAVNGGAAYDVELRNNGSVSNSGAAVVHADAASFITAHALDNSVLGSVALLCDTDTNLDVFQDNTTVHIASGYFGGNTTVIATGGSFIFGAGPPDGYFSATNVSVPFNSFYFDGSAGQFWTQTRPADDNTVNALHNVPFAFVPTGGLDVAAGGGALNVNLHEQTLNVADTTLNAVNYTLGDTNYVAWKAGTNPCTVSAANVCNPNTGVIGTSYTYTHLGEGHTWKFVAADSTHYAF